MNGSGEIILFILVLILVAGLAIAFLPTDNEAHDYLWDIFDTRPENDQEWKAACQLKDSYWVKNPHAYRDGESMRIQYMTENEFIFYCGGKGR